jgi:GNAT superfamily N-acetyltransferase
MRVGWRIVPVDVRPVRAGAELARFIRLPWRIYAGEPRWVPPLVSERRRFLDRGHNPFFEHAEAEYFLAWRDGEPVGRISAHVDHRLNEFQGNAWGLWGFFECLDDPEAAHALLGTAEEWLRARGRDRMVGPMDFTTNHPCGLLVEGHELRPQILEPWQHAYYRELVEGYGMVKAMDLLKWEQRLSDRERFAPVVLKLAERLEPEHGIRIRHIDRRHLASEVRRFLGVYHSAWSRNWGFVPLTEAEVDEYARELRRVIDPAWAMLAERDGETVGAALALPDYNQVLAGLDGRLLPLGWLRALRERRRIDELRVFALGVVPEYQHTGVAAALYVEYFNVAARSRMRRAEAGWILEANTAMNRAMEAVGARIVKRHRLYEKAWG